jgi:antirestriction protein ArdC
LQRLLVGWNRSRGVNLVPFSEKERTDVCGSTPVARPCHRMREYTVFNVDQCDNLPDSINTGKPMRVRNPDTRDELADAFLHSTGADIREGHGEACYIPSRDFISMHSQASRGRITSTT